MTSKACNVDDCTATAKLHGMCIRHCRRWQRTGDPTTPPQPQPETAVRKQAALAADRRDARFEDIREMISWRVHPDEIARRIGVSRAAIERQARNWDARDIARYVGAGRPEPTKPCPDCGDDIRRSSKRCAECAYIARWVKGAA